MAERRSQASRSRSARDGIVQAALGIFALKGYTASSMDDLCLAAGCSKGGLYHHFPSKRAVLSAVVDQIAADGRLLPSIGRPGGDAIDRILLEVWAEAARDAELRTQLREAYEARVANNLGTLGLIELLRIGTVIQLLMRQTGAAEAATAEQVA